MILELLKKMAATGVLLSSLTFRSSPFGFNDPNDPNQPSTSSTQKESERDYKEERRLAFREKAARENDERFAWNNSQQKQDLDAEFETVSNDIQDEAYELAQHFHEEDRKKRENENSKQRREIEKLNKQKQQETKK